MRVLGIDASMTSTGLAVVGSDYAVTGKVESAPPKRARGDKTPATIGERRGRIRRVADQILEWAAPGLVELAVIEGPSYSSAGAGTWDRAWLWGQIVDRLIGADIPVVLVPPGVRAKWATGNGAVGKSPVAVHMSRMWPDVEPSISDDEWDALALASFGAQYLGLLPITLARHREQLGRVTWPDIPAAMIENEAVKATA